MEAETLLRDSPPPPSDPLAGPLFTEMSRLAGVGSLCLLCAWACCLCSLDIGVSYSPDRETAACHMGEEQALGWGWDVGATGGPSLKDSDRMG